MTDIAAGRTTQPAVFLRLKRQQGEHVVDVAAHRARTAWPPGPDRGSNVVYYRNRWIADADPLGHPQRKIGAVDDHENIRRCFYDGISSRTDQPQQFRQL